jgi:hypothetical protein
MNRSSLFVALLAAGAAATAPALAAKPDPVLAPAAVTTEEVGDAGSFGKNMKWLGLASGYVQLLDTCTPLPGDPAPENCIEVNPAPAVTTFNLSNLDSVTLPGRSTETLICHWQTPIVSYSAVNPTASPASLQLRVTPVYRIQSDVLNDPALIDPGTGLPFGGVLELALTSINLSTQMQPGDFEFETITGTRMCIGGLVSKQSLVDTYGLTEAQANRFFRRPITISLGIRGQSRLVDGATINIGTRFVGD